MLACAIAASFVPPAHAYFFIPNDLFVSESTFVPGAGESSALNVNSPVVVDGAPEPGTTGPAIAYDANLGVFANSAVDGNFGISAPLSLVQIDPATNTQDGPALRLPTSRFVTSFSSKSEGSL